MLLSSLKKSFTHLKKKKRKHSSMSGWESNRELSVGRPNALITLWHNHNNYTFLLKVMWSHILENFSSIGPLTSWSEFNSTFSYLLFWRKWTSIISLTHTHSFSLSLFLNGSLFLSLALFIPPFYLFYHFNFYPLCNVYPLRPYIWRFLANSIHTHTHTHTHTHIHTLANSIRPKKTKFLFNSKWIQICE